MNRIQTNYGWMTHAIWYEPMAGSNICLVSNEVSTLAEFHKRPVLFVFNDTFGIVKPGDTGDSVEAAWRDNRERELSR